MRSKTSHSQTVRKKTKRQSSQQSRLYSYFFLTLNAVIWGAAFVIIKPSYAYTTPLRFLLYRFLLASMFGIPFLIYYWSKVTDIWKKIRIISLLELLGIPVALGFLYSGLDRTTSIEAGFLTTTVPIFVVLFGIWFLNEKEEKREWEGLALAFLGTVILALLPLFTGSTQVDHVSITGNVLILIHNVSIGIYYVMAKKYYQELPKFFVASISFFIGALSFFLLSLGELGFSWPAFVNAVHADILQPSVWIASTYMGILGSVVAFSAYIIGQDGVEASEATLFSYLQPLVYVPLGIIFLSETVRWQHIAALTLIFSGVILGEWRGRRK